MNSIFICFVVIFLQLVFFSRLKKKEKKIIIILELYLLGNLLLLDPTIRSSSYSTSTSTPDLQAVKSRGVARTANELDFKLASTTATGGVSTTSAAGSTTTGSSTSTSIGARSVVFLTALFHFSIPWSGPYTSTKDFFV